MDQGLREGRAVGRLHGRRESKGGCARPGGSGPRAVDAGLARGQGPTWGWWSASRPRWRPGASPAHPFASAPVAGRGPSSAPAWPGRCWSMPAAPTPQPARGRRRRGPPWPPAAPPPSAARPARCCCAAPAPWGPPGRRRRRRGPPTRPTAALGRRGSGEVAKALTASGGVAREHAVAVGLVRGRGPHRRRRPRPRCPSPPPSSSHRPPEAPPPPWCCSPPTPPWRRGAGRAAGPGGGPSFERVMVDQAPGMADAAVLLANATAAAPDPAARLDGAAAFESALTQLCEDPGRGAGPAGPRGPQAGGGDRARGRRPHRRPGRGPGHRRLGRPAGRPGRRPALLAGRARRPGHRRGGPAPGPGRGQLRPGHVVADGRSAPHDERAAASVAPRPRSTWPSTSASAGRGHRHHHRPAARGPRSARGVD
jgi:hypothetical protein